MGTTRRGGTTQSYRQPKMKVIANGRSKALSKNHQKRKKSRHDCFWKDIALALAMALLSLLSGILLMLISVLLGR